MASTEYEMGNMPRAYVPLGQSETKHDTRKSLQHTTFEIPSYHIAHSRSRASIMNLIALIIMALIPIISMSLWGSFNMRRPDGWNVFSSAPLAGRFTQSEAKAMDVLCSAVLAPLLMVVFNYIWFTSARVGAVNEVDKQPTTLQTLSIAASSTGGSYNVFSLWHLVVKSGAPRIILLGFLILAAAVANTSLTNVIAYEAYTVDTPSANIRLQYLRDNITDGPKFIDSSIPNLYQFSNEQTASFSEQFTGVLTGLSITDATKLLNESDYYLINATMSSLEALKGNTVDLPDVPALKYSVDCEVATPVLPFVQQSGEQNVQISMGLNQSDHLPSIRVSASYPGQIEALESAYNERYAFLGFPNYGLINESYIGFLASFDLTNNTYRTKCGLVQPIAVNMSLTNPDFTGTKAIMSWWGMRCWMTQTPGTVELHRSPNTSWTARAYKWQDDQAFVASDWIMNDLQLALGYVAPGSTLPGIGSALVQTAGSLNASSPTDIDYITVALNLLYAEGEAKRILYEVAAMNQSRAQPDYFYEASASSQIELYRLTYVPFILFVGELAILFSTIICLVLLTWTWKSESGRNLRKVDVLRLVVDTTAGLRHDEDFVKAAQISNGSIDEWAGAYLVRYRVKAKYEDEGHGVILTQASANDQVNLVRSENDL